MIYFFSPILTRNRWLKIIYTWIFVGYASIFGCYEYRGDAYCATCSYIRKYIIYVTYADPQYYDQSYTLVIHIFTAIQWKHVLYYVTGICSRKYPFSHTSCGIKPQPPVTIFLIYSLQKLNSLGSPITVVLWNRNQEKTDMSQGL